MAHREICKVDDLQNWLVRYSEGQPQMIFLQAPSGDGLTIGVGGPLAYIEYTQASGDPPYLAAQGDSNSWDDVVEFDAGGTATEIPLAFCIPIQKAITIATHFFTHRSIPGDVEWAPR